MRGLALALVALSLAARGAHAEVVWNAPPPPPDRGDFWRNMLDPHATEVNAITMQVQQQVIGPLDMSYGGDYDTTSDQRVRMLQVFEVRLRYARKLSPENLTVLSELARIADELGDTRQAIEALQAALAIAGPDKAGPEITGRLGAIELRLGDLDAAIRYLRQAQGAISTSSSADVLIDLATALAMRGETSDAIDVLAPTVPTNAGYSGEQWGVVFALAVLYDRDDQRSAAFDQLDRLQATLQDSSYGASMQGWLANHRFTPAEDQHYYTALLYESLGDYAEARAEWALYAASGGAFRGRALEHVAAIDAQRRAQPGVHPTATAAPQPPPVPFRVHRRRHP